MKRIKITRNSMGKGEFEMVTIDPTENVFFINLDPVDTHWPDIAPEPLDPAPSDPSTQCFPQPEYKCRIPGHETEKGFIRTVESLTAVNSALENAIRGQPIAAQQVVSGGLSPYTISSRVFEIRDASGALIQEGSGIGPGLHLNPSSDDQGISVSGTPTITGTYTFSFTVDDGMGTNLQQAQWVMEVAEPS